MRSALLSIAFLLLAQAPAAPPATLPDIGVAGLTKSLAAAKRHASHVWRDTPPLNEDGTINAYVEIARGDRRKWEFDMARHERAIDRVIPDDPGGYPVNYGFVPQTVSYDGDPFDVLVLGPPIEGGTVTRGIPVGLFHMEDDKGLDSKVVVSPLDRRGAPAFRLTDEDRRRMDDYFARYKQHESGKSSRVMGWGSARQGVAFVKTAHAFFKECRLRALGPCTLKQ